MIEYQPTLFDTVATDILRQELAKQRKSFFVRYNYLEQRYKDLETRFYHLEKGICAMPDLCSINPKSGLAAQQDSTN